MAPKPPLPDEAVREIIRLHDRKLSIAAIAVQFDRSAPTIYSIVHGKSYRHVTATSHGTATCSCVDCTKDRRRDENVERAEAAEAIGICVHCGRQTVLKAAKLIARPGQVSCVHCDQRKRD